MEHLGFSEYHIVGHDRGARVCHRLMLDHPEKVLTCTMMDILPTYDMYERTNREFATKYWHWFFYIQPFDFPERFLGADPDYFIRNNLLKKPHPKPLKIFLKMFCKIIGVILTQQRCNGISEDYRAAESIDLEHDIVDRVTKIKTPLLVYGEPMALLENYGTFLKDGKT